MSQKIATLIDAENISHRTANEILNRLSQQGEIILCAVYGDWEQPHLQSWKTVAESHKFKIRHQTNHPTSKNSTDMKLIMDAMDILHRIPVDAICLVTNDADYVPLCDKAHEYNKDVIGMGYRRHAADAFMRSCDIFIFIETEDVVSEPLLDVQTVVNISNPTQDIVDVEPEQYSEQKLKKQLVKCFEHASADDSGWVSLSAMGKAFSELDIQYDHYGFKNLTNLLESQSSFIELRNKGGINSARLRNQKLSRKQLHSLVKKAYDQLSADSEGWVKFSSLGTALLELQPNFKYKQQGYSTLKKLLQSMSHLVEIKTEGSVNFARLKK